MRGMIGAAGVVQAGPGIGSISLGAVSGGRPFIQSAASARVTQNQPAAAADETFRLGEAYCFPNPVLPGKKPTIHVEAGLADAVELRFYDDSGHLVHEASISGTPQTLNDGQGPQYAYEYTWNEIIPGGTYVCAVRVRKNGGALLRTQIKLAVIP